MPDKNKKMLWGILGTIFVLAIISGALAGVVASVMTNQSLDRYFEFLSQGERLVTISEVKPRPLPGTYEEALERVQEIGWPSLASMRAKSEDGETAAEWILPGEVVGFGAVITSDGWILFHTDTINALTDPAEMAEVWVQQERFTIEELVYDDLSDFVMVKVAAQNLTAPPFGASDLMQGGEIVFSFNGPSTLMVTSLRDTELVRGDIINPAEVFETQWELADTIAVSGPLFNSAGEFIGLSAEVTLALPLHHGLAFVHAVLRSGESEHAALGAYVVDIDAVLNIDPDVRGEAKSGALLTSPGRKTPAVLEDGPAASAGLKEGDVIVSVDDTIIAGPISLAEVLTNYRVESQATLKILRDGEIQEVQVTFVNYRNLIY